MPLHEKTQANMWTPSLPSQAADQAAQVSRQAANLYSGHEQPLAASPASSSEDSADEEEAAPGKTKTRRGTAAQVDPLDVRFSQKKMRHNFWNGTPIKDVSPLVRSTRLTPKEAAKHGVNWKLEAPFPLIEVVRWRCKLRDEKTGRPKLDAETGKTLYDPEEHFFTLDNRRLYCLQIAAVDLWPQRCVVDVWEIPPGRPELMREMKKFKTIDSGRSISIGSKVDKVPFMRWSWQERVDRKGDKKAASGADAPSARATSSRVRSSAAPKAAASAAAPQTGGDTASAGAFLLQLLKEPDKAAAAAASAPQRSEGTAMGAELLGLLKGTAATAGTAASQASSVRKGTAKGTAKGGTAKGTASKGNAKSKSATEAKAAWSEEPGGADGQGSSAPTAHSGGRRRPAGRRGRGNQGNQDCS